MRSALVEASHALDKGEVPVGAVVTYEGRIVGRGHNAVESLSDPTAHAELIAITAACQTLSTKVLSGCCIYVTLEPCPMCAGAIVLAKLDRLVFGAFDEKTGAASTLYNIVQDDRLNHRVTVVSGIEADESAHLLQEFFRGKRST